MSEERPRAQFDIWGSGSPDGALRPKPLPFPRTRRIRKRPDFVRIQGSSHRVGTRHFLLLLAPGDPASEAPRVGLVASRKVGGAVARNRAKRLLREAFRRFPEIFPPRVDIVILVRPGVDALGLAAVVAELRAVAPLLRRRASQALAARAQAP